MYLYYEIFDQVEIQIKSRQPEIHIKINVFLRKFNFQQFLGEASEIGDVDTYTVSFDAICEQWNWSKSECIYKGLKIRERDFV